MIVCLLAFAMGLSAQGLTVRFDHCTVLQAMEQLKGLGVSFMLKSDQMNTSAKVNATFENAPLETIVKQIFAGQDVTYAIDGKTVVVTSRQKDKGKAPKAVLPVTGTIVDGEGFPVIGASVYAKKLNKGTVSDLDGHFSFDVDAETMLEISYVGFETQKVQARPGQTLKIVLTEDAQALGEVVIVGFGTQKKVNLTGSVATVSSEDIKQRPVQSTTQALQGLVAGLNIQQQSGLLDSDPLVDIRGIGSISTGSTAQPLVLIDGVEGSLNSLNPQDIENISVLKDAAASSVYGSRAPFGVILITTKSGGSGKTSVNYNNNLRWSEPTFWPRIMNSYDFVTFGNDACRNTNVADFFSADQVARIKDYCEGNLTTVSVQDPDNPKYWAHGYLYGNANVNCFKEYFKKNSFSQEHNVSMSGGDKKYSYYLSMGFLDQHGLLSVTDDVYQRFTPTAKIDAQVTDWMRVNYTMRYTRTSYDRPIYLTSSLFSDWARQSWPEEPGYDDNGYIYMDNEQLQLMVNGGRATEITNTLNNHVAVTLEPVKDWVTIAEFNFNPTFYDRNTTRLMTYAHDYNGDAFVRNSENFVEEHTYRNDFRNLNVYSTYNFALAHDHHFKVMAGMQYENFYTRNSGMKRVGVISDDLNVVNLTSGYTYAGQYVEPSIWGSNAGWATAGYFGRLNYDYGERYLLEANIRYDGSSRFRSTNRWNWFPSFSAGWNVAKEAFWEGLTDYVSTLKVRASYGSLGNQNTNSWYPTYQTMGVYINNGTWLQNGKLTNTAYSPDLISSSLTWERVVSYNVGFDLAALSNRLTASFDYFQRFTTDMVGPAMELPAVLGAAVPSTNNTDLRTYGFDLELQWRDRLACGLNYSARLVLSDSQTEILKYPNEQKLLMTNLIHSYYPGSHVGDFWGLKTIGIAKTDQEMNLHLASLPHGGQTWLGTDWRAGDIMYADLDGDGVISPCAGTLDDHGDLIKLGNDQPRY